MMVFEIADWWLRCWFLVVCWCSLLRLGAPKCNWSLLLALGNIWSPFGSVASRYLAAIRKRPKQMLDAIRERTKWLHFKSLTGGDIVGSWWFLVAFRCAWKLLIASGRSC